MPPPCQTPPIVVPERLAAPALTPTAIAPLATSFIEMTSPASVGVPAVSKTAPPVPLTAKVVVAIVSGAAVPLTPAPPAVVVSVLPPIAALPWLTAIVVAGAARAGLGDRRAGHRQRGVAGVDAVARPVDGHRDVRERHRPERVGDPRRARRRLGEQHDDAAERQRAGRR